MAPGEPGSCSDRLAEAHQPGGRRAALPGPSQPGESETLPLTFLLFLKFASLAFPFLSSRGQCGAAV